MILAAHILIALTSLAYTSYLLIRPSRKSFKISYGLIGATLASGTYLVVNLHSALVQSCLSGLTYLGVIITVQIIAHYRLAQIAS